MSKRVITQNTTNNVKLISSNLIVQYLFKFVSYLLLGLHPYFPVHFLFPPRPLWAPTACSFSILTDLRRSVFHHPVSSITSSSSLLIQHNDVLVPFDCQYPLSHRSFVFLSYIYALFYSHLLYLTL